MSLLFSRERFQDFYNELLPLAEAHYEEIAWRKDKIPLSVDYEKYCILADAGVLLCFTVRSGRRLIGYSLFLVTMHLHYSKTKMAVNDIIFLAPEYRNQGNGAQLIDYSARELKALGTEVITYHIKPQLDWGGLCESLGYEMGDRIWQKWLGD